MTLIYKIKTNTKINLSKQALNKDFFRILKKARLQKLC